MNLNIIYIILQLNVTMPISKEFKNTKLNKKVYNTRSSSIDKQLKKNSDSDSSEDEDEVSTHSDSDNENDGDDGDMDVHEYRKFLQKIFPSKDLQNKITSGEKLKKLTISNSVLEEEQKVVLLESKQ